ncbi:FecR family protein [Herbaspirillum sp. RV1423]|uniref:FecR family protein n=1 Tax=Herbaspirillum sp. RV1423 TaxID=1443993 RepID=UPI00055192D8|nr:FecR domain-containing protein [Herbaspirillum sp. RV1423]
MNVFEAQEMGPQDRDGSSLDADARAWVRLLASGRARKEDARKLELWCAASAAHAAAFKQAHALWRQLGTAAELVGAGDPELQAIRRAAGHERNARAASATRSARRSRRAFLGGAVAASAVAAGVALIYPPLSLWPSMAALRADYRTEAGQQMQVALTPDVGLLLNTRSSISVRTRDGSPVGVDLIDGEIAVSANRPFSVSAGNGTIAAEFSRFEVRHLGANVCVTCMEGQVNVALAGARHTLRANQQMVYGDDAAPVVASVDAQQQSDWRRGILSFRQTALGQVIGEINRYRPGRLVLMAKSLEQRPVSGRFRIDDLDKAIAQIQRLFRLSATSLPGGIIVLA